MIRLGEQGIFLSETDAKKLSPYLLSQLKKTLVLSSSAIGLNTFAINEVEIDFGTTPKSEQSFIISASGIKPTNKIICSVSYEAPTGKDQDELEMDDLQLRAVAGTDNFTLYVKSADGSYLADKFKINYSWQ